MKLLNLYITRNLLLTTVAAVCVLTFVMVSANLIRAFDLLARGVGGGVLLSFILCMLPDALTFTIPLALLCATVLVFSRLSADNEVTAMRASGIGLWQIVSPALLLSIVLSGLCLWLNTTVAPIARYRADLLKRDEGVRNPLVVIEAGRFVELPGHVIRVGRRDGARLHDIHIYVLGEDGRVSQDITARRGQVVIDDESRVLELVLEDATIAAVDVDRGSERSVLRRFASQRFSFPLDYGMELDRRPLTRRLKFMDVPMIFGRMSIDSARGIDTTPHAVELNARLAKAMSPFAFLLLGIPFGIRTRRSETSVGLLVSLVLALGFYVFLVLADALKYQPALQPEILVWLPNILYQVGGLWALARIAKQ